MQICSNILEEALAINDSITGSDPVTLREKRVNVILLGREKEKTDESLAIIDSFTASLNPDRCASAQGPSTRSISLVPRRHDRIRSLFSRASCVSIITSLEPIGRTA